MIPESKKSLIENALQVTFGTSEIEYIRELTSGLSSAVVYRIVVLGKAYVLRIIMREEVLGNLGYQYRNMRAAAEIGVAPGVWYTGMDDRISITDFIETKVFPVEIALIKLPDVLRRLHALPPFPFQVNYMEIMYTFDKRFRDANMLPGLMAAEIFSRYERMKEVYPNKMEDMVSCHNDTKIDNIIFDGERPWLVDWEASFLNDRYLDLAVVANFVVWSDDDESKYLAAYFGRPASEYEHARFFLMRQFLHMSYITFLLTGPNCPPVPAEDMPRPGFQEFHDLMWTGKISIGDPETRQQYALVNVDQLRHNLSLKRFDDSLKIVEEYKGLV